MDGSKIRELKDLLDEVVYASTKKDAKPILRRLEFKFSLIGNEIDAYHRGKLSEAIGYAQEGSGRVNNKEHWIQAMNRSWYVFESGVRKREYE